jgi:hypothetical protein
MKTGEVAQLRSLVLRQLRAETALKTEGGIGCGAGSATERITCDNRKWASVSRSCYRKNAAVTSLASTFEDGLP